MELRTIRNHVPFRIRQSFRFFLEVTITQIGLISICFATPIQPEFEHITDVPKAHATPVGLGLIAPASRPGASQFQAINELLQQREYQQVISQSNAALKNHPNSGLIYEVIGTAYFAQNNYPDAANAFSQATGLEPRLAAAWVKLGIVQMAMENLTLAEASLQRAVGLESDNRLAHQRLGMIYDYKKNDRAAIAHYRAGLIGTPDDYLGVALPLANLLNRHERYAGTLEILEPRLPLSTKVVEGHFALAYAYLKLQQFDEASARFDRILVLRPNSLAAGLGLVEVSRGRGTHETSVKQLRKIITHHPRSVAAHFELAQSLLDLDQFDAAKEAAEQAVRLGGSGARAVRLLAEFHIARAQPENAIPLYESTITHITDDLRLYTELSELYLATGQLDKGENILRMALATFPNEPYAVIRLASYLATIRDYPRAEIVLREALTRIPDHVSMLSTLVEIQKRQGDYEASLETSNKILVLAPNNPRVQLAHALNLEAADRATDAIKMYELVIKAAPNNALALNNLANLIISNGNERLCEAEIYARRAAALAPDNIQILDTLGWIHYRNEHYLEAEAVYANIRTLDDELPVAHYHRGLTLLALAKRDEGISALRLALEKRPDATWAPDAHSRITHN